MTGRLSHGSPVRSTFGTLPDGCEVESYSLRNAAGASVTILTLGGIIQSFIVPDRDGNFEDVVLGYPNLKPYIVNGPYFGAIIGRYANRIANGQFALDGNTYTLSRNEPGGTLHGGAHGFDKAIWSVENVDESNLRIRLVSQDGDQGFPGTLRIDAHYSFGDDNALTLAFEATTSAPTIINLTNHTYWNLAGAGNILDHVLQINADFYTPLDSFLVPTTAISLVGGTPFDFRKPSSLRQCVTKSNDRQIGFAGGIDHNFIINSRATRELTRAATLCDPHSGRSLEVLTTEPGLQVYSGNSLAGGPPGKRGAPYERWDGVALETQHFPDSPNRSAFPTTVLRPGENFRSTTVFRLA